MGSLNIETIDLAELSRRLDEVVPAQARTGALFGRTAFRDATMDLLRCSALEAEQLVDTLVARAFLVFDAGFWRIRSPE